MKNNKVRICNPAFNQCCGSGSGAFLTPRSGIRYGQKSGSGINIPDPRQCFIINPPRFETVCAGMQKRLRSRYLFVVRAWKIRKVRICIFLFDPNPLEVCKYDSKEVTKLWLARNDYNNVLFPLFSFALSTCLFLSLFLLLFDLPLLLFILFLCFYFTLFLFLFLFKTSISHLLFQAKRCS